MLFVLIAETILLKDLKRMSKETINITLDHFNPKEALDYGWRNNSEEYMKLDFTVEVLDKDGQEVVNKQFKGYGPYPYKNDIEINRITVELKLFMIEEIRPMMNKDLFIGVCKTVTKSLMKSCDDAKTGYWEGSWEPLFDKKPVSESSLDEVDLYEYSGKKQQEIIALILKDERLLNNKEIGEMVSKFDAEAGYKWVEASTLTLEEYIKTTYNRNTHAHYDSARLSKSDEKFLLENDLDRGAQLNKMLQSKDGFDIKNIGNILFIRPGDVGLLAQRLSEVSGFEEVKGDILTKILGFRSWFDYDNKLPATSEWSKVVVALRDAKINVYDNKYLALHADKDRLKQLVDDQYITKDALDENSLIYDTLADVWVTAYLNISQPYFKGTFLTLMIHNENSLNRRIIEKAMAFDLLYSDIDRGFEYIDGKSLGDKFKKLTPPKSGPYKDFYESGILKEEGSTLYGVKDGLTTQWSESGEKLRETTYSQGVKEEEVSYKNGVKNGVHYRWYPTGIKMFEANYKDDDMVGPMLLWDADGTEIILKDDDKRN